MASRPAIVWRTARILILALCGAVAPAIALGQTATPYEPVRAHYPDAARAGRVYFGMWTAHLKEHVRSLHNNWVAGAAFKGYFGATFLNSYGRRAYTGGIQRTLVTTDGTKLNVSLGYRLGFVTGYDGRLMAIARKTPVLPLVQPFVVADVGHVGFEISYTFVVVSVATSYRF